MSTSEWVRHKLPQVIKLNVFAIDVSVSQQTWLDCPSVFWVFAGIDITRLQKTSSVMKIIWIMFHQERTAYSASWMSALKVNINAARAHSPTLPSFTCKAGSFIIRTLADTFHGRGEMIEQGSVISELPTTTVEISCFKTCQRFFHFLKLFNCLKNKVLANFVNASECTAAKRCALSSRWGTNKQTPPPPSSPFKVSTMVCSLVIDEDNHFKNLIVN